MPIRCEISGYLHGLKLPTVKWIKPQQSYVQSQQLHITLLNVTIRELISERAGAVAWLVPRSRRPISRRQRACGAAVIMISASSGRGRERFSAAFCRRRDFTQPNRAFIVAD